MTIATIDDITPDPATLILPINNVEITFRYKNWRDEVSDRCVIAKEIRFQASVWHPEPQWLLVGLDKKMGTRRLFAMRDMWDVGAVGDPQIVDDDPTLK
jgi:hypothetical protein